MTALQLFRVLVPSLCQEDDGRVGVFLDTAAQRLTPAEWGAVYAQALVYLAAHLLTQSPGRETDAGAAGAGVGADAGGPVTSKKAGDLAVTFGALVGAGGGNVNRSNTDADLLTTHWGRQFLALRDTRAGGIPTFVGLGTDVEA